MPPQRHALRGKAAGRMSKHSGCAVLQHLGALEKHLWPKGFGCTPQWTSSSVKPLAFLAASS